MAFARAIEERIGAILQPTGLVPHCPHDMRTIMAEVDRFTHLEFETEATVSSLTAAIAARQGYDGVVVIAPFACLPGRLIKAMVEPYARKQRIPFIAVESDGQAFPPSLLSRLEVFMLNVHRRGSLRDEMAFRPIAASPASCSVDVETTRDSAEHSEPTTSDLWLDPATGRALGRSCCTDATHHVQRQDPPRDCDGRRPQL